MGGIVLVAMMKVNVSKKTTDSLKNVKEYQMYLGRYILFLLMGLFQSGLICLGDLYYLGIQCEHPFLFVVAGWMASIAFVNLIYTLTVSFGDIGKAVCVILLVIQVAGSGGTFPIEVAPAFFKRYIRSCRLPTVWPPCASVSGDFTGILTGQSLENWGFFWQPPCFWGWF
ncbi:MAG: hypothetical protein ACLRMZ_15140 [Blautia marasmi]